jgi:hypothetical protein
MSRASDTLSRCDPPAESAADPIEQQSPFSSGRFDRALVGGTTRPFFLANDLGTAGRAGDQCFQFSRVIRQISSIGERGIIPAFLNCDGRKPMPSSTGSSYG